MDALFFDAVVQHYIKTTRHGDDQLMQSFVRMPTSLCTARHVVKIVNPTDIEWDVLTAFNKREITARVRDFREINQVAIGKTHWIKFSILKFSCESTSWCRNEAIN
jgi:hypothetical protein